MSNFVPFQNQLASIMEILAKAAVAEINRCVDDSCAVFRLEISQSQKEIETLKQKLQVLELELRKTQRQMSEFVFGQEWSFRLRGCENLTFTEDVSAPLLPSINRGQSRCEQLPVKLEEDLSLEKLHASSREEQEMQPTPEDEEQVTQASPVDDGKKPDTEPTPVGDSVELREQHRCGHSDEVLSGLKVVVKAEQEEEHVAQRLNQTGCELSAGRLNTLDSEYVMYERDNQLSMSYIDGDVAEQCSVNMLSSFGVSYAEEFDEMDEKPSVCSEELRSEAVHAQQGLYRERLRHTVERENQTLLPQQQQHGPSVKHRRGSESPAQPHSGSPYETSSARSTSAVNTGTRVRNEERAGFGKEQFVCTYCGKICPCYRSLIEHQRFHTGEKPYSCAQCGRCFKRKDHLDEHDKLHSGYRPFVCPQCGKRFSRGTNLRRHQRTHTGERPYRCTVCERSFSYRCTLLVHQRSHCRVRKHQSATTYKPLTDK